MAVGGDKLSIERITTEDLRRMEGQEGLILQGCDGDLEEWRDGINEMLTQSGILLDGTKFEHIFAFEHEGVTCLLFPFEEEVKVSIGRLAIWRIQTHDAFWGKWLSDFVPNSLGGFITEKQPEQEKPDCALIGQDGNIFNLAGIASRTLREHGKEAEAEEMKKRIFASGSYGEALNIIGEYVNITDSREEKKHTPPHTRRGR